MRWLKRLYCLLFTHDLYLIDFYSHGSGYRTCFRCATCGYREIRERGTLVAALNNNDEEWRSHE